MSNITWILSLKCQPPAFFGRCQLLGLGFLPHFAATWLTSTQHAQGELKVPTNNPHIDFSSQQHQKGIDDVQQAVSLPRSGYKVHTELYQASLSGPHICGTSADWASVLTWHKWPRAAGAGRGHHSGTLPVGKATLLQKSVNSHIPSWTGRVPRHPSGEGVWHFCRQVPIPCLPPERLHTPRAP